jgi:hypothetical protein
MKKGKKIKLKRVYKFNQKFLIITLLVIAAVVLVGKNLSQNQNLQTDNVLGLFLSKGGDDSGGESSGSSGSGSSGSGSSGSSESEKSGPSGSSGSGSSDSGSSENESGTSGSTGGTSGSSGSSDSSVTPTRTRVVNPTTGIRTEQEIKQDEQRTEVRLSETERIRTRTKDGRTRIDITQGGIKTRFEIRDDRVVIKAEQEDGTEVELADDAIFKIEERLATNQIKIVLTDF